MSTHVRIIVHSWHQVVNEGLQGAGHQVAAMVIEAGVALLLGLVQIVVVATSVQLPLERWCLRHVVLWRQRDQTSEQMLHCLSWHNRRAAKQTKNNSRLHKVCLRKRSSTCSLNKTFPPMHILGFGLV